MLPLINNVIFQDDVNTNFYGNESNDKITNSVDSDMNLIFNLNFNVDEVEELFDLLIQIQSDILQTLYFR